MSATLAHALVLVALLGQPTEEEDTADRKVEAGKHLQRGNDALKAGDAAQALEAYREAYDAFPSSKIFFNMAEAHRELGELVEAADLYERVTADLEPDSPLVNAAQDRLTALDAKLGRLSVSSDPAGARIEIDGREVGTSPLANVRVPAGSLEVRATYEGRSETQSVEVEAGGSESIEIALVEVAPPIAPPVLITEVEDEPVTSKWWFWTAIGVGVVAAGTAAALVATSGDDFRPSGELGITNLDDWRRR